tara:strand:- start:52 stop:531 length:480 start_codon:yes stop_codon:yes gene_type:complete
MNYIIQINLEHKENIMREISISSNNNLEELHYKIIDIFKLDKNEIGSFYTTNSELDTIKEISLINMDNKDQSLQMKDIKIKDILNEKNQHLIYVYDFLIMWRFLITYINSSNDENDQTIILKSIGKIPKKAPEISFADQKNDESLEDNIYSEIGNEEEF